MPAALFPLVNEALLARMADGKPMERAIIEAAYDFGIHPTILLRAVLVGAAEWGAWNDQQRRIEA